MKHDLLYVLEGCSRHGCKVGISSEKALKWRIANARLRCKSAKVAKTWRLPNAFAIEQFVISIFSCRHAPPGEEWFNVPRDEMIDGVEFVLEVHDRDPNRERRYRLIAGHVSKA